MFMSDSRSKKLYVWTLIINTVVTIDVLFATGLLFYNIFACALGELPLECREGQYNATVFLTVTFPLILFTIWAFIANLGIVGKIRQSVSIKGALFVNRYESDYY